MTVQEPAAVASSRPARLPAWPTPEAVAAAHALLARGGVLAVPTESSYGLAVDPRSSRGVETIYRLKERDRGRPLPVIVGSSEQLGLLPIDLDLPPLGAVRPHWPAALSLVVPLQRALPAGGTAGPQPADRRRAEASGQETEAGRPDGAAVDNGPTLAVRVPAHPALCAWLDALECPLTATSANRSGEPPLLDPEAVEDFFAKVSGAGSRIEGLVIDGGTLAGGLPSTLVAWRGQSFDILRPGRFDPRRLTLGPEPTSSGTDSAVAGSTSLSSS